MITKIISIGNSRGIRIPSHILKQLKIENQIELIVDQKQEKIVLRPINKTREGWDDAFKKMSKKGDDNLIINDLLD